MPFIEYAKREIVVSIDTLKKAVKTASSPAKQYSIDYIKDCLKIYGTGYVRVGLHFKDENNRDCYSVIVYPLYYTRFSLFVILDCLGTINDFDGNTIEKFKDLRNVINEMIKKERKERERKKMDELNEQESNL